VSDPRSRIAFPNLHSVLPSADGRFAYFVSLGADLVAQYALGDDLRLVPLTPETVAAPAGSGPRHLVLNAAQDAVYVLTEFSGEVLHYARDTATGALDLRGAAAAHDTTNDLGHSVFGADPLANHFIWGADLHFGTGEGRLWASERTESTLGAVTVAGDGTLSAPTRFTVTETQPRGFALSPDGAFLVAAGERSTTVSLYAVHDDELQLLQQAETGAGANWVRFA
jgi:6-phosphogluconolactonase